eukprot:1605286-Rhodomonas_salina.1
MTPYTMSPPYSVLRPYGIIRYVPKASYAMSIRHHLICPYGHTLCGYGTWFKAAALLSCSLLVAPYAISLPDTA